MEGVVHLSGNSNFIKIQSTASCICSASILDIVLEMGRIFKSPVAKNHDFLQKLDFQLFRMMEAEQQSDEVIRRINLKQHCCCSWLN